MKIQDQTFQAGRVTARLKDTAIDMLENMPSGSGVDAAKQQIALAEKLKACNGVLEVTPEDVVLLRGLIDRHPNMPPAIQVGMYEAFDPGDE